MTVTLIIECTQCSGLMLAAMDQKTRVCSFCGVRVNLLRAKRLASAESSMMASEMLRKIKSDRQINTKKDKGKYTKTGLSSFYK